VGRTPKLNYSAFTVALRFKAEEFDRTKRNLLTGGTSHRWFGLPRSDAGNLTVTMNNQRFSQEVRGAALSAGKWTLVACSVDLPGRKVVAYLNGKKVGDIDLSAGFKLDVVTSRVKEADKEWSFTNYSNGTVLHGLVDELIIYGKALGDRELAVVPLRP
jgi:hypothetical protein